MRISNTSCIRNIIRCFVFLTFIFTPLFIFAQFGGGAGTANNPWQISTPEHLDNIRDYLGENHSNKHFIQTDNIDLDVEPFNEGSGWISLGNSAVNSFRGDFNGNGYVISNLYISRATGQNIGLFGYTVGATIMNVTLSDFDVTSRHTVGGLIGYSATQTDVINCHVEGLINGTGDTFGLLVAHNNSSSITGSSSAGKITTGNFGCNAVGGLVGLNSTGASVINSYSSVEIIGGRDNYDYGGLVGQNFSNSIISGSFATGSVTVGNNTYYTGGLLGRNRAGCTVRNSYSFTEVNSSRDAGGLIGQNNQAQVLNSYSIGLVNSGQAGTNVGGFVGSVNSSGDYADTNNYWNTELSEQSNSAGNAAGKTTDEMTYQYADNVYEDWDFIDIWQHDPNYEMNNGYPYHRWMKNPYPNVAESPQPNDEAIDIPLSLTQLSWVYIETPQFTTPVGFRIYFNTSGEFDEDDDFDWVAYSDEDTLFSSSELLPESLDFDTSYYWMVVPTRNNPEERHDRGDAVLCPVWTFTTVGVSPNPDIATDPNPEDRATGITLDIPYVSWSYISDPAYTDPVGFRIYINITGAFGPNAQFCWVPYDQDEELFSCLEIGDLVDLSMPETTYFWRVVPTTEYPEDRLISRERRLISESNKYDYLFRNDAVNAPIWRFTTGTTDIENNDFLNPLSSGLLGNYPNPFNPKTNIRFFIAEDTNVLVKLFNSKGQHIATLVDEYLTKGDHTIVWDGSNSNSNSGIYFCTMSTNTGSGIAHRSTIKMLLLK